MTAAEADDAVRAAGGGLVAVRSLQGTTSGAGIQATGYDLSKRGQGQRTETETPGHVAGAGVDAEAPRLQVKPDRVVLGSVPAPGLARRRIVVRNLSKKPVRVRGAARSTQVPRLAGSGLWLDLGRGVLAPGASRSGWVYLRTQEDSSRQLRGSVRVEWEGGGAAEVTVRASAVGAAEWAASAEDAAVPGVQLWAGAGVQPR